MTLNFRLFSLLTLLVALAACSQNPEDLIDGWKDDGWTYVATHGTKGDVKRTGRLQSEKAQAVEALWNMEIEKPNFTNEYLSLCSA